MSTDLQPARGTWERYWEWASIVSMLRLQPGTWMIIGAGHLVSDLKDEVTHHIFAADRGANAGPYEVRAGAGDGARCPVEARLVR